MSANCPKCGSDQLSLLRAWITDFECGSTLMLQDYLDEAKAGDFKQSKICRELAAANAEIERLRAIIDALPDASEGRNENITWVLEEDGLWSSVKPAIHAERIPVPPHLAEAQRVVIRQAQQAGDGAEEK